MNKNNADLLKILILVALIILAYVLSGKYMKIAPQTPTYQNFEQDNRLGRISQGLKK